MKKANLTVNLIKSEFCHAKVIFLGHVVGLGQVTPVTSKIESVCRFPVPSDKRDLMRFLGMVGYYRKFCPNFSTVTEPLTTLLRKGELFVWSNACQQSFEKIKLIICWDVASVFCIPNGITVYWYNPSGVTKAVHAYSMALANNP